VNFEGIEGFEGIEQKKAKKRINSFVLRSTFRIFAITDG